MNQIKINLVGGLLRRKRKTRTCQNYTPKTITQIQHEVENNMELTHYTHESHSLTIRN